MMHVYICNQSNIEQTITHSETGNSCFIRFKDTVTTCDNNGHIPSAQRGGIRRSLLPLVRPDN